MLMTLPLIIGSLGLTEIVLLVLLVVLLFGGKRIPELMRGMGRGVKEFKDAVNKDYSDEHAESGKSEDKSSSDTKNRDGSAA